MLVYYIHSQNSYSQNSQNTIPLHQASDAFHLYIPQENLATAEISHGIPAFVQNPNNQHQSIIVHPTLFVPSMSTIGSDLQTLAPAQISRQASYHNLQHSTVVAQSPSLHYSLSPTENSNGNLHSLAEQISRQAAQHNL